MTYPSAFLTPKTWSMFFISASICFEIVTAALSLVFYMSSLAFDYKAIFSLASLAIL